MKHQIEFTTIELMMIRSTLGKKHFYNNADCLVASEIINKIDKVVNNDLPKVEQINEQNEKKS